MNTTELIEKFVATINAAPREPKTLDEVPARLRSGEVEPGWYDWRISQSPDIDWIDELESKLPARFPNSFATLIRNYEFPTLNVGPLTLFSNTKEGTEYELRSRLFHDPAMSPFLLRHGFIQFGQPATGSYDPVCFDARKPVNRGEYPIVHTDHEAILSFGRIGKIEVISESFYKFIKDIIMGAI